MHYRTLLKSFGLGVGAALVAMAIFPLLARSARRLKSDSLSKSAIKGGLSLKEQLMKIFAESKEKFEDLVAEAKEEMSKKG